jgi:hypothetical protein
MDESDSISFTSMCPNCGRQQAHAGLSRGAIRRLITKGHPVEGYCETCDVFWSVSDAERAETIRKLTIDRLRAGVRRLRKEILNAHQDDRPPEG